MSKKPLLIILAVASLIIFTALLLTVNNKKNINTNTVNQNQSQTYCQQDSDCIWAYSDCSSCECGKPVNKKYKDLYEKQYKEKCQDYRGPVCDFCCPFDLKCQNNTCVKTPNNKCG
jgi:hypothetical protein